MFWTENDDVGVSKVKLDSSSFVCLQVFDRVRGGTFPDTFKDRLTKVHDAVKKMITHNPKRRPSAAEVLKYMLVDLKNMNRKAKRSSVPVL